MKLLASFLLLISAAAAWASSQTARPGDAFMEKTCYDCHDGETKKGGLDLTALPFYLDDPKTYAMWVKVHDRVHDGEMPPKKHDQPDESERDVFLKALSEPMIASERAHDAKEGRATQRRLNRYEYENTLRDLLHAPWLQIKEMLPEDGEAYRFNKIGDALDVSHVQMSRYLAAADYALRQVMATQVSRPATTTTRYYARDQKSFAGKMKFSVFNKSPERATFPLLGTMAQPDVRSGKLPITVGSADPATREQEAMGVVASSYEPIEIRFDKFKAPTAGFYRLRFSAYSVWVGPGPGEKWWHPDLDAVSPGRRPEPVTIYSETPPRQLRLLGSFDVNPDPTQREIDTWLLAGEEIRTDAARLFRSRPPNYHNPLAQKDGQPGVAFRWMEAEGPIYDQWPTAGQKLLFGDLPLKPGKKGGVEVVSTNPAKDAERLIRNFLQQAYREPASEQDVQLFLGIINGALKSGSSFSDAMIAGYSGVLCSPAFVCLEEKPGHLDDRALASRLAYFLWNSPPDDQLRAAALRNELHRPDVLRTQTTRMIADPKASRFVDAFLDYWLDLRKNNATSPDAGLYPDYYLDDLLVESATAETQLFFSELLHKDLPARNIVSSNFAMLNERLADHYGLPKVDGVALRKVILPPDSVRGGLLTQASVLKVTANGTTTSPVLRGVWVMERILSRPPPPPPPNVPAVDPDTRGATTIREQLSKHRKLATCAACHAKIDPAGFALENFDVFGGWRDQYRALGEGEHVPGFGKNGQPFNFHEGPKVDASGALPDGRKFADIRELKKLLLADERQIARNLARQLVVYATGAPVRFGDRPQIEQILDRTAANGYGVQSLIQAIVQNELFQEK
jgi:mono/diheme cytochrome c family protein